MKADFSKTIFETYFGLTKKLVVITLHDKTELTGKFTGFFRGEKEFDEPYIIKWRFVNEEELKEIKPLITQIYADGYSNSSYSLRYPNQDAGRIIRQQEIATIRFK
jgi:hypothetical protein